MRVSAYWHLSAKWHLATNHRNLKRSGHHRRKGKYKVWPAQIGSSKSEG
jgi:hypothetical protein